MSQELKKMKKTKSGSGTDEIYDSKWPYFAALKFLIPALTINQTKSSMTLTKSSLNAVRKKNSR